MVSMKRMAAVVVVLATLAGCGGEQVPAEDSEGAVSESVAPPDGTQGTDSMPGMAEMPGMGGMMTGGMMDQMQDHMQEMQAANGERMMAMMPEHRQMAANMMAQMNREMRDMNMAADAEWNATVDSVRQDLTRIPEMTAEELTAFLPEHQARLNRLIEMHTAMTEDMQM